MSFRASAHTGVGIRIPKNATNTSAFRKKENGLPRRFAPRNDTLWAGYLNTQQYDKYQF